MRLCFTIALLGALGTATPALAQDKAVDATIVTFVDAFNKGDVAAALATMAEKVAIVDEVAPFHWHGKEAFANWGKDYEVDAKAKGITEPSVTMGTPTRELATATNAYVIVPVTYRFAEKGVKMAEVAQMTFTLEKGTAGWKISSWTWTGPTPTPAK